MAKKLYAAYGSNINLEQMAYRCPHSTVAGTAMLKGYELQFRHHATIEPNEESEVPVLLWELDSQDEKFLDCYEGEPKYYRKDVACHAKRKKLTRKTKKTLLNTTFKSVFYYL